MFLGLVVLICIYAGFIIIFITIINKLLKFVLEIHGPREKTDYMNLNWLKHQYFDLGKSLQHIATNQNVSILKIKRWIDKLENPSNDLGDKD